METLNASIPLSGYTAADYQKQNVNELQIQALRDEATQRQQSIAQQKSLREAFTGADTSTAEGQKALLGKVGSIDPNTRIKLEKEFSEQGKTKAQTGEIQAKTQKTQIESAMDKADLFGRVAQGVKDSYQSARSEGKPEPEAIKAAQSARTRGMIELFQNGVIDEDKLKQMMATPFDVNALDQTINQAMSIKDQLKQKLDQEKLAQTKKNEDALRSETARHNRSEEGLAGGRLAVERERLAISKDEMSGAKLTPEAIDQAAEIYAKTGAMPPNLGRGKQGAETISKIANRSAELLKGQTSEQIIQGRQENKAEARTRLELGAREGKIAPRVQEAKTFAEIALKASDEVDRGTFRTMNKFLQKTQGEIGDEKLRAFQAANNSLINAYSAAIAGGSPTVSDKEHARDMLSTADNPKAYRAVVNQMLTEANAALAAPKQVMEGMRSKPKESGSTPKTVNFSDLK